jgi:2-octaprenyl-6-methoxyphenol hydroxylase
MRAMSDKRDLLILGGGLVGMTLALAAARKGLSSHVVDRADPAELIAEGFDGRASAISTASWNLFGNIGLTESLEPHACPIASIAVTDGMKPGRIDFQPEPHEGSLGRMFANRTLRLALFEAAANEPLIAWHPRAEVAGRERGEFGVSATLADGRTLEASLMVAAEGRNSPTREEAGIAVAKWEYDHRAIITVLGHEKPHANVAWEIFYPAGPFALLPLLDTPEGGHRSALVWTVAERDAAGVLALSDRAFTHEVAKRMHGIFGAVTVEGPRSSYPLGFHHTATITAQRLALVGDAAHGIHPIAGQGLNLGLRDVGALVEVIAGGRARSGRCAVARALRALARARQHDGRARHRRADPAVRRPRPAAEPDPPPWHERGPAHPGTQALVHGRGPRGLGRAAGAAEGVAPPPG